MPDIITLDKIQHLADSSQIPLLSLALISYQHFPEFIATSSVAMFEGPLYGSKLDFCCREGVMGRNVNAARQAGRNAVEYGCTTKNHHVLHGLIIYS